MKNWHFVAARKSSVNVRMAFYENDLRRTDGLSGYQMLS